MDIKIKLILGFIVVFLAIAVGTWLMGNPQIEPGKYDIFASCLKEKGATFYGTFWCPYCQRQKAMFGTSKNLLPYVECSTPDGRGQLPACTEKNVKNYPTWEFADGSRLTGAIPLETLAEKTGCTLPK